jgi:glutamate carboxypeptidase
MLRRSQRTVWCAVLLVLAATAPFAQSARTREAGRVDAARLMRDVESLSAPALEGRLSGTPGNKRAQAFITAQFKDIGLEPLNGTFEQKFSFKQSSRGTVTEVPDATNLIGIVPGTVERDRCVVVSAHYDHLGVRNGQVFRGADDNASGVAGLLAIARWFRAHPARQSILFAAFDGEESGLQGARHFVAHPPFPLDRISTVLNLDMIGRGDKNVLFVAGTHHYPALRPIVEDAARGRSISIAFGHDQPNLPPGDDWTQSSDHGPFHTAGVPFLYFGVEDHPDYHKPSDTADKIPRAFYAEAVEMVLSTVQRLADAGGQPSPRLRLGLAEALRAKADAAAPARQPQRGGTLTPEEQRIVAAVDAGNTQALALLERVVNINSGSMNFAGVRAVGDVLRAELEGLGFSVRWIDGAPFKRAGHLVAERPGRGPRVLLIGHLDTVFEPESPFQRFERIDEKTARGPGIIDMKGGDVVMISALKALSAAGSLDALQLRVVLTGDEELTGEPLSAAREALVSEAKRADIAIGFENGPGDPRTAVIARRGTTGWLLRVKAKPAHSSQIFREDIGAGAIYEAARILQAFRETLGGEPHLTFNPGVILGGTAVDLDLAQARGTASGKENVIAAQATVMGDLRALSAGQFDSAKSRMREIVAGSLPHAESTLTFDEGYPPLAPGPGNERLLALYDQASRDVGAGPVGPVNPDRAGAADVSFAAGHVRMVLDGIGLMGHSDHTPQETADLSTLPSQTKRAALLLHRIGQGAAGL